MTKKQKKSLARIFISGFIFLLAAFLPISNPFIVMLIYLLSYAVAGSDVIPKAFQNIGHGQIFDENFLMTIATSGAFIISEFPEGVAVMIFYQIGELFQSIAVNRSRKSIAKLMNIRPDFANLVQNNKIVSVSPDEVHVGDLILVKPGERIPLDGIVVKGTSLIDTKALTGESLPRELKEGDEALSGCICQTSILTIQVTKTFGDSTVSKILELVESASSKKAKAEHIITRFAKYYTPCVVISAVMLAILPPLLLPNATFREWFNRTLIFLVVSCPCALVISVPLSFFGGIGGAGKQGILIKGSNYLEALSHTEIIVFDKTGTLTTGTFRVTKIVPLHISSKDLLRYAAYAEHYSSHPISISLKEAYKETIDLSKIKSFHEIHGKGIKANIDGTTILIGNEKLMLYVSQFRPLKSYTGTVLYIALNGVYEGYFIISDELKPDAVRVIQTLKHMKMKKIAMLTGDISNIGNSVARKLGIHEVYSELLPADKVKKVEHLLKETSKQGKLVFVGDGMNDAPVLTRADIGIAMGAIGSDAAIEAADIVLMTDELSKICTGITIARKTHKIVYQNIIFALSVKIIVLILGALGVATMWFAVFADVGVSVIAILNATRALQIEQSADRPERKK